MHKSIKRETAEKAGHRCGCGCKETSVPGVVHWATMNGRRVMGSHFYGHMTEYARRNGYGIETSHD